MNVYGKSQQKKDFKSDSTIVIDREWLEEEMLNNDDNEVFESDL